MYEIIILPIIAALIAQLAKFLIKANRQKFNFRNIFSYSGMPSGHSAMMVALVTIVGLEEGWDSTIFAVAVIVAIVIIRDALGLRRYLGEHGKILNVLVKDLKDDELLDNHYPHLIEKIGHTPSQVIAGAIIGFLVSWVGYYFIS